MAAELTSIVEVLTKYGGQTGITIIALWFAYTYKGDLATSNKERASDWKAVLEVLETVKATIVAWTSTNEARNRAAEATARAQDLAAVHLSQLAKELESARSEIAALKSEVAALRSEVRR